MLIHRLATKSVTFQKDIYSGCTRAQQKCGVTFQIQADKASIQYIYEILNLILFYDDSKTGPYLEIKLGLGHKTRIDKQFIERFGNDKLYQLARFIRERSVGDKFWQYYAPNKNIDDYMQLHINRYNKTMQSAYLTDKDKLLAIIRLVRNLEMLHPFQDANLRTFGVLLFNKLLYENGFEFASFYDPNQIDGKSIGEIYSLVAESMQKARQVQEGKYQITFKSQAQLKIYNLLKPYMDYCLGIRNLKNDDVPGESGLYLPYNEPSLRHLADYQENQTALSVRVFLTKCLSILANYPNATFSIQ